MAKRKKYYPAKCPHDGKIEPPEPAGLGLSGFQCTLCNSVYPPIRVVVKLPGEAPEIRHIAGPSPLKQMHSLRLRMMQEIIGGFAIPAEQPEPGSSGICLVCHEAGLPAGLPPNINHPGHGAIVGPVIAYGLTHGDARDMTDAEIAEWTSKLTGWAVGAGPAG